MLLIISILISPPLEPEVSVNASGTVFKIEPMSIITSTIVTIAPSRSWLKALKLGSLGVSISWLSPPNSNEPYKTITSGISVKVKCILLLCYH